jgi:hypothetical protein
MPKANANTRRTIDAITADARKLRASDRNNAFAWGRLLIEAEEVHGDYGEWTPWLKAEFPRSERTARNFMNLARLEEKSATVADLKVPLRVFYELDPKDANLEAKIKALQAATKGREKMISEDDAEAVIRHVELRLEHGDYPAATLDAINDNDTDREADTVEALKAARPETTEAADKIVLACHKARVEKLLGAPLPEITGLNWELLNSIEYRLGDEDEDKEYRDQLSKALSAAPQPLDADQADAILNNIDNERYDRRRAALAKAAEAEAVSEIADRAQETSAASRPDKQQDFGPLSAAEHERMDTVIAEAAAENTRLKTALAGSNREIERLEGEIAALKTDTEAPKMSVDKHIEVLAKLLKNISKEARLKALAALCSRIKLDPLSTNTIMGVPPLRDAVAVVDATNSAGEPMKAAVFPPEADTEAPRGSHKKLVEVLANALKKIAVGGQLEAIEELCRKLKLDPRKLTPTHADSAAASAAAEAEWREQRRAAKNEKAKTKRAAAKAEAA